MGQILFRAQLKGSTAAINKTAGVNGVLVFNTDTNHLHILSGRAGQTIELANREEIPDITNKVDKSYVDEQLNTKLNTDTYNVDKPTFALKTEVTESLNTKLGKTEKAESAKTADNIAWSNVTGTEKVRTTDTKITADDLADEIDYGEVGE